MKRVFALAIVPIAAFTLAACGGDDRGSGGSMSGHGTNPSSAPAATAAGQHNDQDVMFAQMMIPHHRQAIDMARLASTRASAPQVKQLAAAIEKAQDPEIKQMTGWLTSWGAAQPAPGMPGMDHGSGGADGMMTEQDMKNLGKLSGKAFDQAFLEMMIKHHQGAITMAKAEQAKGMSAGAKTLADAIITSQSAEITTMQALQKKA